MTYKKTTPLFLPKQLNRRQFVRSFAMLVAGGFLVGCDLNQRQLQQEVSVAGTPTPARVMASPQPDTPEAEAAASDGGVSLEQFMQLSMALTGFTELSPVLGQTYLHSLQNSDTAVTLAALYQQAGLQDSTSPQEIDPQIFEQESSRSLADKILEYWYTGVFEENGQPVVATTTEALVWQALNFTKPLTVCGPYPGFWVERPAVAPMPSVHEISLTQPESSNSN